MRFYSISTLLMAGLSFSQPLWAEQPALPPTDKNAPKVVSATPTKEDAVQTLTLEDSIQKALKETTEVLKAQSDRDVTGTGVLQSYLQFLPNLTAQGTYNYLRGQSFYTNTAPTLVNGFNYGPAYTVSTTLNIFNGFSDVAGFNAAHSRRSASDKTLTRVEQQISLDIAQSYLQVILDQRLVLIAEENYKASVDRQTLLEEQTKVGIRNLSDLFRQQAQTASDESFLVNSRNRKETDLILFLRKMRINPDDKYALVEPPLEEQVQALRTAEPTSRDDQEKMIDDALHTRVDYQASQDVADATKSDVTSYRSSYWPRLDFAASYGATARHLDYQYVSGTGDVTPASQTPLGSQLQDQTYYTYGLVLTWTIFDRWTTSYQVERAKGAAYKAQLDSEDYRRQVIGEVKQAVNDLHTSVQNLLASEKGLVAARKAYEVSQGRYDVGQLSFVDLAVAQTALVQAQSARAQSLIDYELRKRTVDFAMGTTPTIAR